jgi:hypothetical protein
LSLSKPLSVDLNKMEFLEEFFDDDLDILEIIDVGFSRFRYTRSDKFHELDKHTFNSRFRLTKQTTLDVLIQIEEELEFANDINDSISPMNQLLTTLRFYASVGHLATVADYMGMHVSTTSRIIAKVSRTIARLRPRYIKMPEGQEIQTTQNKFYEVARFPRVLGVIDGSHIKIQSPGGNDGEIFRNRKGYFSVNIQAVCDPELKILDIVARWLGSAHDSTIFNNSRIRFENGEFPNALLLGDSGYPVRSYFFTPLTNPVTRAQQLYNESHIRTRNAVERLFGCWKRRFPVLAYGMRVTMKTILAVIIASNCQS